MINLVGLPICHPSVSFSQPAYGILWPGGEDLPEIQADVSKLSGPGGCGSARLFQLKSWGYPGYPQVRWLVFVKILNIPFSKWMMTIDYRGTLMT